MRPGRPALQGVNHRIHQVTVPVGSSGISCGEGQHAGLGLSAPPASSEQVLAPVLCPPGS